MYIAFSALFLKVPSQKTNKGLMAGPCLGHTARNQVHVAAFALLAWRSLKDTFPHVLWN